MAIYRGSGGSVEGITEADIVTIAISQGGTGATTAAGARTNLGLATVASTGSYNDLLDTPAGGGTGTVTSVDMSVPTGLSVSGNPVTTSGTLAVTLTSGYSIPTTSSQTNWDTAYGWGNHASSGYVTSGGALGTPSSGNLANCTFPTLNQNTTGSAATLTTGRTIGMTGDLTWTSASFNGSANVTGTGTLATVNSNVGSFGSSSAIPIVTVNAKGLVTAVSTATVAGGQYFGSAATKAIAYNSQTIAENVTVTAGNSGLSAGPITISSGYSVTVESGSRWVIL